MPIKFIDYIVEGKHKYGIKRSVNQSFLNNENKCFVSNLNKSAEPKMFDEAFYDPNWVNAMNEEMESLYHNRTWDITKLSENRKPIRCKWVYRLTINLMGKLRDTSLALLLKREDVNYQETFSPVAKFVAVRIVISQFVKNSWPLYQLDINNLFLYGDLFKNVYVSSLRVPH